MAEATVVATGLRFPEGPVWCPPRRGSVEPGSIVCTSVAEGTLVRVDLGTGGVERVADVGGGANAAWPATDGGWLVTQNGGIDFAAAGLPDAPPYVPVTPGIQRVWPDGSVEYVADEGFLAPNDLVVGEDGVVWFTDPPRFPPPADPVGSVHRLDPDGTTQVVADGFAYCNGIALEPGGTLVVVEAQGLVRMATDGSADREWITERLGASAGDGLAVDVEGRLYVAATADHGVRVLDPDGTEVDFLALPGHGITTNCCFGGLDGRTLFATDGLPGHLVAWEGMPSPGLPVHPWRPRH